MIFIRIRYEAQLTGHLDIRSKAIKFACSASKSCLKQRKSFDEYS